MVFAKTLAIVVVPGRFAALSIVLVHIYFFWVLFEVRNIMCCVSSLENRVGSLGLLLALPKEVLAEADSELRCEHVSTGGSR